MFYGSTYMISLETRMICPAAGMLYRESYLTRSAAGMLSPAPCVICPGTRRRCFGARRLCLVTRQPCHGTGKRCTEAGRLCHGARRWHFGAGQQRFEARPLRPGTGRRCPGTRLPRARTWIPAHGARRPLPADYGVQTFPLGKRALDRMTGFLQPPLLRAVPAYFSLAKTKKPRTSRTYASVAKQMFVRLRQASCRWWFVVIFRHG